MIAAFLRIGVRPSSAPQSIPSKRDGADRPVPPRRLVQAVGVGLTLLGLAFTGRVILENAVLGQLSWDGRLWAVVAVACAAYALLSVLLVLVWATILHTFAPGCIGARQAFALYATTQIMKYVPSNIVHYIGRHVALRRRGVAHLALVSTVFVEAAVLAGGACLTIAALEADLMTALYRRYVATGEAPIVIAVGLACCLAAILLGRRAGVRGPAPAVRAARFIARLIAALAAATLFFAAATLLVSTACRVLLDDPLGFEVAAVAAALAGAWVVGFVMPGASAGIGVREAAVILLLSPALGAGNAAAVAAIYRLVTAGGDALFAALGGLVRRSVRLTFLTC